MTANTTFYLSKTAHDGVVEYFKRCVQLIDKSWDIRTNLEEVDKSYYREVDLTLAELRARRANKNYDPTKFRNIIVPVIYPQVESAVTYQANVFLSGNPIFGVVASPQFMNEAMMLESIIAEQQLRGKWISQFMKFFRDGFKYNLSFLEIDWKRYTVPSFESDGTGGINLRDTAWEGNCLDRWDPYNTYFDYRCHPVEIPERGEFIGTTKVMSKIEFRRFIHSLRGSIQNIRLKDAFESSFPADSYYVPSVNPEVFVDPENQRLSFDWETWAGLSDTHKSSSIKYKNAYTVSTFYARIVPKDFSIFSAQNGTPQIWKFIVVNDSACIYAERQTNAHDLLPVLVGQPLEDGLGYQTKSFAKNVEPFQHLSSALVNMDIASRRRAISDRVIYDPSRVSEHHMNSDNPAAKIPVRPAAYGKPVSESVYQFPYRETEAPANMSMLGLINQYTNLVTGQNPVRQGQFVKGNKTKREFEEVMGNATGRDQTVALLMEDQIMTPAKYIIKSNILQYQGGTQIYNRTAQQVVEIDPIALRKAILEFKVSDGLVPSEKLINGPEWEVAMQVIGTSPFIGRAYNIAPMFSYMMKVRGADLRPFEKSPEQIAYEDAVAAWQQAVIEIAKKNEKSENPQPYPPQPTPQQFNWGPRNANTATNSIY